MKHELDIEQITGVLGRLLDEADLPQDIRNEVSDLYSQAADFLSSPAERCSYPNGVTILPDGVNELDPCAYAETEVWKNVTVRVLQCERCGHVELEWEKQPDTFLVSDEEGDDT